MSFEVAADAYDAFMGRWSRLLAPRFADVAGARAGLRVLDVGCGTGALTDELVRRTGLERVSAIDPSGSFVEVMEARFPGLDIHRGNAEHQPYPDDRFDLALAQLVVHFMTDPLAGLVEMRRVTRTGGAVAACVWDFGGNRGPLGVFWDAARAIDPSSPGESDLPGTREGHLSQLFDAAGLEDITATEISATIEYPTFEAWWQPFTRSVGPAGSFVAGLDPDTRRRLRDECRRRLPGHPIIVTGTAWATRGSVP